MGIMNEVIDTMKDSSGREKVKHILERIQKEVSNFSKIPSERVRQWQELYRNLGLKFPETTDHFIAFIWYCEYQKSIARANEESIAQADKNLLLYLEIEILGEIGYWRK